MIIPPNPVATIQRADAVEVSDSVFADSDTGFDSVRFGFSYGGADSDSGAVAATLEPRGWWDTTAPFARCRDRQLPPPAARGAPWFPLPDARPHWRCRTRPAASSAALVLQECSTCSSHLRFCQSPSSQAWSWVVAANGQRVGRALQGGAWWSSLMTSSGRIGHSTTR